MTLNSIILGNDSQRPLSVGTYAVPLAFLQPGLMALYQEQCRVPLDDHTFGEELRSFISRGGQIHCVLDTKNDDRVSSTLGFATVMNSCSLLQNMFPVERFVVDVTLPHSLRHAVAMRLIQSIVDQAEKELPRRHDDIWIRVSFPAGANALEVNQPIYTALEQNGFQASRTAGMVSWSAWMQRPPVAANEAT